MNNDRDNEKILSVVSEWTGNYEDAVTWYRGSPLVEFGGLTAEKLVQIGRAAAVHEYLEHVAYGGFS